MWDGFINWCRKHRTIAKLLSILLCSIFMTSAYYFYMSVLLDGGSLSACIYMEYALMGLVSTVLVICLLLFAWQDTEERLLFGACSALLAWFWGAVCVYGFGITFPF